MAVPLSSKSSRVPDSAPTTRPMPRSAPTASTR
jgi:hypothetical protein